MIKEQIKAFFLDTIFPISCIGCQKKETWLCQSCFDLISIVNENSCRSCHKKYKVGNLCPQCDKRSYIDEFFYITVGASLSHLVLQTFHRTNAVELQEKLQQLGEKYLQMHDLTFSDFECTFIPLHPLRKRLQGHDGAQEFAFLFADILHLPLISYLSQKKWIPMQKKVPVQRRYQNVFHAFQMQGEVKNKSILLLDTMLVTGSTMQECARILKENGASKVSGMVFARSEYLT